MRNLFGVLLLFLSVSVALGGCQNGCPEERPGPLCDQNRALVCVPECAVSCTYHWAYEPCANGASCRISEEQVDEFVAMCDPAPDMASVQPDLRHSADLSETD